MMMGIGFGVRKIPNTLPGIVFALFTVSVDDLEVACIEKVV